MLSPPKCAVNMEKRLAALRRDQEIDGLRVYLIKYDLFPRNRDPHNSPIRVEELKELVKHWKLHHQRSFWRDHPEKDDLIRALLQHIKNEEINKKRRLEAQEKHRNKNLNHSKTALPDPTTVDYSFIFDQDNTPKDKVTNGTTINCQTDQIESSNEKVPTATGQVTACDKVSETSSPKQRKSSRLGGDLFYQRGQYNEGLIYLSRFNMNRQHSKLVSSESTGSLSSALAEQSNRSYVEN